MEPLEVSGHENFWPESSSLGMRHEALRSLRGRALEAGWLPQRGGYRSQKLPGGDHSALGDALATLRLIEEMAAG